VSPRPNEQRIAVSALSRKQQAQALLANKSICIKVYFNQMLEVIGLVDMLCFDLIVGIFSCPSAYALLETTWLRSTLTKAFSNQRKIAQV